MAWHAATVNYLTPQEPVLAVRGTIGVGGKKGSAILGDEMIAEAGRKTALVIAGMALVIAGNGQRDLRCASRIALRPGLTVRAVVSSAVGQWPCCRGRLTVAHGASTQVPLLLCSRLSPLDTTEEERHS